MKFKQFGATVIKLKAKNIIGKRIVMNFLGVLILTFLVTILIFSFFSKQFTIQEIERDLEQSGKIIETNMIRANSKAGDANEPERFKINRLIAVVELFDAFNKTQTVVISNDEVIYPVRNWSIERVNNIIKQNRISNDDYIKYEYIVQDDSISVDELVFLKKYEDAKNLKNIGFKAFLISFSIGMFIAFVVSIFMSQRLYKPIRRLNESVMAYKNHKEEVTIFHSKDEIEDLAYNFKEMTEQLNTLDDRQKQFFQNSSHELKTPLMSIQGYAEAIKDGIVEGAEMDKSLNIIISETQRLKSIVDDVIYLSKIDNMEDEFIMGDVILKTVIEDAVHVVTPLLQLNDLIIEVNCKEDLVLFCDKDKMKRVFINLISNGSRYARTKIVVNVNQHKSKTIIDVIDDGEGFEYGQEDKVFDRFYNGKKGGSGIGLSLTQEIIKKHSGTIKAINNMNYGAVFKIEL